jgi:hypothetical protein
MIRRRNVFGALWMFIATIYGAALAGDASVATNPIPKDLDIYLLIGDSGMAGTAEIPAQASDAIDRCYLFTDKNPKPFEPLFVGRSGGGSPKAGPRLRVCQENAGSG